MSIHIRFGGTQPARLLLHWPLSANAILVDVVGIAPVNVITGCEPLAMLDGLIAEIELGDALTTVNIGVACSTQSTPLLTV